MRRSFTISFRIYDGQSQQKNLLILTHIVFNCLGAGCKFICLLQWHLFSSLFLTIGLTYNVISIIISLFKHKLHINDSIPYNSIFLLGGIIIIAVRTLIKICFGVHCQKLNQEIILKLLWKFDDQIDFRILTLKQ